MPHMGLTTRASATIRMPDGTTRDVTLELTPSQMTVLNNPDGRRYSMGCTLAGERYRVGDQISTPSSIRKGLIIREITEVRETGYQWKYVGPDYAQDDSNSFMSENSTDPFLKDPCWILHRLGHAP